MAGEDLQVEDEIRNRIAEFIPADTVRLNVVLDGLRDVYDASNEYAGLKACRLPLALSAATTSRHK